MNKSNIYKLRELIYLHNYLYYVVNNPLITDKEYDVLYKKFINLNNNKFIIKETYKKKSNPLIRYHTPMLSLKTVFSNDKLSLFLKNLSIPKNEFCCELKIDGVGINLIYKNKKLIYAGTRGDGFYGENITQNIFLVPDIPKYLSIKNNTLFNILPDYCEIRGEIFINKKDFSLLKKHFNKFNIKHLLYNSRNLAAGILKKKEKINPDNNQIFPQEFLKFYAYSFLFDEKCNISLNKLLNTQWKRLNMLRLLNFRISKLFFLSSSEKQIFYYYQKIKENMDKMYSEIDGIVLKINNIKLQKNIGNDSKYPKWAIAFKFPATNNKISYLRKIKWNMSRLGVLTPIACIVPINIGGANISQLNLHNYQYIKKLDIRLNDALMIFRSGEIIPKINYVIKSLRAISYHVIKEIKIPTHCQYCNSLIRMDSDKNLFCTGNSLFCSEQLKYNVLHFISSFNIKNFGESLIDLLIKNKLLSSPIDIFRLNEKSLASVTNFTYKTANKIINSIKLSKIIFLKNLIYSLSIPDLGWLLAKKINSKFSQLYDLLNTDYYDFVKKTGLTGIKSELIFLYLHSKEFINLLMGLINIYKIKIMGDDGLEPPAPSL